MPELPEVETVANGVNERVHGQRVESAWFSAKPEPFRTPAAEMSVELPGRRIDRVRRVGKHIVVDLSARVPPARETGRGTVRHAESAENSATHQQEADAQWLVHLGMTGRLLVCSADTPVPPHTHAVLRLSSGKELRFVDARRFGRLALLLRPRVEQSVVAADEGRTSTTRPSAMDGVRSDVAASGQAASAASRSGYTKSVPVRSSARASRGTASVEHSADEAAAFGFRGPGLEPLTIAPADFIALFKGRRLAIKSALLNQKLLHGVGNIYADESLFRAGIRPRRMAGRLSRAELLRLRTALVEVLRAAIALGGSSVSDYVDADGVKGFFQLEHRVYQRTGQSCLVCGTPIRRIVLGGRSTHYCIRCQS
ncbi:MAG TPA: DNA-formamidopyrimidine glycosylase family protein [Acidisarcina sp.]